MTGVVGRMVRAALEANGVAAESPPDAHDPTPTSTSGAKPRRRAAAPADVVLLLGAPGVLVRTKDGRLPRDGEVEPDGACLRIRVGRSNVLVAGAMRRTVKPCRWATAAELDSRDLEVVRAVAPSQLAELEARARVAALAREVAELAGVDATGDPEVDLRAALVAMRRDESSHAAGVRRALDFAVAEHMLQA